MSEGHVKGIRDHLIAAEGILFEKQLVPQPSIEAPVDRKEGEWVGVGKEIINLGDVEWKTLSRATQKVTRLVNNHR